MNDLTPCPECGEELEDDELSQDSCPYCGSDISEEYIIDYHTSREEG